MTRSFNKTLSQGDAATETAFIAKRRQKAAAPARPVAEVKQEAADAAADLIEASESMQQEIVFQQQKQFKNQIQGFLDGVLLEGEIPEDMQETAQAFLEKQDLSDKKRIRNKQLQCEKLSRSTPQIQAVHKVWVQDGSWAEECREFFYTAAVDEALFFVVRDAANPPTTVLWNAVLLGGFVIDVIHFRYQARGRPGNARDRGATFAFDPAVRTKRRLLISPQFQQSCPRLTRLIHAGVSSRHSKWKLLDSWEEFADKCEKDGRNTFFTIALGTAAEAKALEGRRNVFSQEGFLKFVRKIACVYNFK